MQKVIQFLEKYVQWLALGLGLVWILWVGYAFWASKPVAITINNQSYGPGEVDEYVNRAGGSVATLSAAHKNESRAPKELTDRFGKLPPQYAEMFRQDMGLNDYLAQQLSPIFPFDRQGSVVIQGPTKEQMIPSVIPVLEDGTVTMVDTTNGLSVVNKADPTAPINPNDPQQKVIPPDPANPNAKPIVMVVSEVSWVTVLGKIDMKKLASAFKTAHIADDDSATQFLRVRLVREEMLPDGKWGNSIEVPDLANQNRLPWRPKEGTPEEGLYLDWSAKSVPGIIQPPFYEWVRGDAWRTASMQPVVAAEVAPVAFDASTVKPGEIGKLSPENLKLWQAWKAQKDKEEQELRKSQPKGNRPAAPSRLGAAPPTPVTDRLAPRGEGPEGGGRSLYPGGRTLPGPGRLTESGPANPAFPPPANAADLPQGTFIPATAKDVEIWAHDDTTKPSRTYHYKLVVYFRNPIFGTQGMAKDPANEKKLDVAGSTEWSAPVVSPRKNYFFAFNSGDALQANNPKMKFEYFFWEDGDWKTKIIELHPGDSVGATPWTIVDFRPFGSNNENRAMIINEDGVIETHYYKIDQATADYKRLKGLIKPPTAGVTTGS